MKDIANINLIKQTFDFWDKISLKEQEAILSNTSTLKFSQGQSVYNASYKCLGVIIVKSGELRTFILSESGKEITLYRLGKEDICILSASCLLSQITFDVYIEAEKESEILLVNLATFSSLIEQNIYVENFSLRTVVSKFSDVMWTMEQVLFMNFDKRLAIFILDEATKVGLDKINLTHEQIAKYIGSAREVVSRMLKYFEKEGYVKLHRGGFEIINKVALKQLISSS